jgi:hypothetical protein
MNVGANVSIESLQVRRIERELASSLQRAVSIE